MNIPKKTVVGLALTGLLAVGAFVSTGSISGSVKIALDKEAAAAACADLLKTGDTTAGKGIPVPLW